MDFVKKNWGFLAIAAGCFLAAIGIVLFWFNANKALNTQQEQTKKQLEFFDRVKSANIKLSKDNEDITANNKLIAADHFKRLQLSLADKSHIDPVVPATTLEAVKTLKAEILALQNFLAENNVSYAPSCAYFTFESIAMQEKLPHKDDLFQIFRQLAIIKEVCRLLPLANITSLDSIFRPLNLVVQQEDIYTYTPVEIVVTSSPDSVQKLLNAVNNESKYLFFIRDLDFTAPDQFTDLGASLLISQELAIGGQPGMGGMRAGMGMDPGMDGMGGMGGPGMGGPGMRGPVRPGMNPGMMGMDPGMGGNMPMDGQGAVVNAAMLPPPKRQDYLVFASKQVTMRLRLDLIEFNSLSEEN